MFKQFCQQCSNHRCLKICKLVCTRWELCRGTCWAGSWRRHWSGWSAPGFRTRPRLRRDFSARNELGLSRRSSRACGSGPPPTTVTVWSSRAPWVGPRRRHVSAPLAAGVSQQLHHRGFAPIGPQMREVPRRLAVAVHVHASQGCAGQHEHPTAASTPKPQPTPEQLTRTHVFMLSGSHEGSATFYVSRNKCQNAHSCLSLRTLIKVNECGMFAETTTGQRAPLLLLFANKQQGI